MKQEELIKEYGIEIAIEKVAIKITEKTKMYKDSKDEKIKEELVKLLQDREKIYDNDIKTIKKYYLESL